MTAITDAREYEAATDRIYSRGETKAIVRGLLAMNDWLERNRESFSVGEYTIRKYDDSSYWLEHDSGEGMQVGMELLDKVIHEFYKDNF